MFAVEAPNPSALKTVPFFQGLPQEDLDVIWQHTTIKSFQKNTIILNEGDLTDSFYVVLDGKVKIFLSNESGKEIVLAVEGCGAIFGEMALLDDAPRSTSIMTLEASRFAVISRHDFKSVLAKNPEIAFSLIRLLSQRVRRLTESVKGFAMLNVYGRIISLFLSLAKEEAGKLVIAEKLTQQDIASRVGASREMVSLILKDLSVGGYISTEGRRMTIHKKPPLDW